MNKHGRILIGIGQFNAQALLIAGFSVLVLGGCASKKSAPPPPPSAYLGGIEPPPGFDPYLTAEQRLDRTLTSSQLPSDFAGGVEGPSPLAGEVASGEPTDLQPPLSLTPPPDSGTQPSASAIAQAQASTQWSIVIAGFRGPQAEAQATQALAKTREAGIDGAYLERRGEVTALAFGRYDAANDPVGLAALDSLRAIQIDGARPFARAMLAPPSPDMLTGSIPEYDLRTVKKRFGVDAIYTLQIGLYGRSERVQPEAAELAEYRQLAERAVYELRRGGEQAFYYHAPSRSMVTIGVFGPDDYDPLTTGLESDTLRGARLRHPYNLLNGQGIRERVKGKPENDPDAWRLQPSSLVGIPRS